MVVEQINIDPEALKKEPDCDCLEIIVTRNLTLFPGVIVHFELGRQPALELAQRAKGCAFPIGIICQIDPSQDLPEVPATIHRYGVFADVLDVREDGDGSPVAIVMARGRFRVMGRAKCDFDDSRTHWAVRVKPLEEIEPDDPESFKAGVAGLRSCVEESLRKSGDPQGILHAINSAKTDVSFVNTVATLLPFESERKNRLLGISEIKNRAKELSTEALNFYDRVKLTDDIMQNARRAMDENQQKAFLQSQMEAIREKLYGDEQEEADELIEKATASGMPKKVLETFKKEAEKMRRFNPSTPDYSIQCSYLETLIALPWDKRTPVFADIEESEKILREDHYGLEKVKERILEQLAVLFHNPERKGTILCLVGPPGVGKTSIGQSVANALGRVYRRVSFGGLHDESEIRGHRRTYIGAMPGRIIDAIKRAGVLNPVILLDEVDKIGQDYKGDPAAALLEVLDPEQNCRFHDNYIDVDFDLSEVLFIATANTLATVPKPLIDRMEIIEIPGYLAEEKLEIAKRHLLPRALRDFKLEPEEFVVPDDTLMDVITNYTAESGVRELEKKVSALARKSVLYKMKGKQFPNPVKPSDLYELLGLAPRLPEETESDPMPGVVTGLAWTEVGGAILMAEASLSPAKEGGLTLTGNLGNVMKESATLAYQWIKAHAEEIGVDRQKLDTHTVHVHFPEGAVPKDGPSAGITVTTAIVSALTSRPTRRNLAMTGEIALRGRVLPVGGIREKILAAKRAGVTDIIMSSRNRRDIDDMPQAYRDGLTFHYVDTIEEVLSAALAG